MSEDSWERARLDKHGARTLNMADERLRGTATGLETSKAFHRTMMPLVGFADLLAHVDEAGFVLPLHGGSDIHIIGGAEDLGLATGGHLIIKKWLAAAKAEPKIQSALEGMTVVKEIYVPGKIVNLVVK